MAGEFSEHGGESPKGTLIALAPRQRTFIENYYKTSSPSYGNSYKSALRAGYSISTAKNFQHLKPKWLSSDSIGIMQSLEPEALTLMLSAFASDESIKMGYRLRAIDMLMRASGMYAPQIQNNMQINIQNVLE